MELVVWWGERSLEHVLCGTSVAAWNPEIYYS